MKTKNIKYDINYIIHKTIFHCHCLIMFLVYVTKMWRWYNKVYLDEKRAVIKSPELKSTSFFKYIWDLFSSVNKLLHLFFGLPEVLLQISVLSFITHLPIFDYSWNEFAVSSLAFYNPQRFCRFHTAFRYWCFLQNCKWLFQFTSTFFCFSCISPSR